MKKSVSKEDSIKEKKDSVSKKRWLILIIFVIFFVFILKVLGDMQPLKNTEKDEEEKKKVEYSDEDLESVVDQTLNQNTTSDTSSKDIADVLEEISKSDTEVSYSETVTLNGLNREPLGLVGNDEESLKKSIRAWLNGYGFADIESVTFYGECQIDYNKNTVVLPFTVDMDGAPGFDVIYNLKDGSFSVTAW